MKIPLTILSIGLLLSGSVSAQQAMGRLFLTPAERQALEQLRHHEAAPAPEPSRAIVPPVIEQQQTVTVNGWVRRSDGVATAWINGNSTYDGNSTEIPAVVDRAGLKRGRIRIQADGEQSFDLKPGQTYDPATGAISDVVSGQ